MEVEYSLDMEDLLAFNQYLNSQSPSLRRVHLMRRLTLAIALAVLWVFLCVELGGDIGPGACVILGLLLGLVNVVFFFLYPVRFRQRTRRLVERMYMEGQNLGLFTRRRMTITPETVTDATEVSVRTMKWVAVEKIAVDQRHAYFYVSAASAFILPKAAFATEEEFQEFVETSQGYRGDAPG